MDGCAVKSRKRARGRAWQADRAADESSLGERPASVPAREARKPKIEPLAAAYV
jgi:hypothetical protein